MKSNKDRLIDDTLQLLGSAQPDLAMQRRLLLTIQAVDSDGNVRESASERLFPLVSWLRPLIGAPALILAMVALGLAALMHSLNTPERWPRRLHQTTDQLAEGNSTTPGEHMSQSHATFIHPQTRLTEDAVVPSRLSLSAVSRRPDHTRQSTLHRSASEASQKTSLLAQGSVADHPAPPLPLTEEERLLQRLGRHGDESQLRELTRPAMEAAVTREKDAVSEFFAPLAPLRNQQQPIGYEMPNESQPFHQN